MMNNIDIVALVLMKDKINGPCCGEDMDRWIKKEYSKGVYNG